MKSPSLLSRETACSLYPPKDPFLGCRTREPIHSTHTLIPAGPWLPAPRRAVVDQVISTASGTDYLINVLTFTHPSKRLLFLDLASKEDLEHISHMSLCIRLPMGQQSSVEVAADSRDVKQRNDERKLLTDSYELT